MSKMNHREAKLLVLLSQLPQQNRDIYHLTNKMELSIASVDRYLCLMEARGWLKRERSKNRKSYWSLIQPELLEEASKVLELEAANAPENEDPSKSN